MNCLLLFPMLDSDPFVEFRAGFASFILGLLGIVLMISLAVTIIHVIQGERESAKKMLKWLVTSVVGIILISAITKLGDLSL